jgi:GH25 family lysozyme M1 (1,4-beta-N-acetylmuramidase)
MIHPIYKAILTMRSIRKLQRTKVANEPSSSSSSSDSEEKDPEIVVPEIDISKWEAAPDKEKWKSRHTGFAFSGEAGHALQVTDPGYYL